MPRYREYFHNSKGASAEYKKGAHQFKKKWRIRVFSYDVEPGQRVEIAKYIQDDGVTPIAWQQAIITGTYRHVFTVNNGTYNEAFTYADLFYENGVRYAYQ